MCKPVETVGIDVGAEELWVAVGGRKPRSFSHSRAGIRPLHQWVRGQVNGTAVHYCLEATGVYGLHVATYLLALTEVRVSIVNPAVIAAFGRAQMKRSKTDPIDAELIRAYAAQHQLPLWRPEPGALRQLAALVTQAVAGSDTPPAV